MAEHLLIFGTCYMPDGFVPVIVDRYPCGGAIQTGRAGAYTVRLLCVALVLATFPNGRQYLSTCY